MDYQDLIVKDSSIVRNPSGHVDNGNGQIRVGIIREENFDSNSKTFFYLVETISRGRVVMMHCRQMSKFGGPYNFEEWNPLPNEIISKTPIPSNYKTRAGDVVIVAPIDGQHLDGVILGSLRHPSREPRIKPDEIAYISEFNGLETTIDNDGAFKIKFQGVPTTLSAISKAPPGIPIVPPIYNPISSGTFLTIDKDGSFELSDANAVLPQSFKIDKPGGTFTITSGNVKVKIDKVSQKLSIENIDTQIKSTKSIKMETLDAELKATKSIKISAAQVAIGGNGIELIDTLIQMVDALGSLVVNSPQGPCTPLQVAPTWSQVVALKTKLSTIKGSL